MKGFNNIGNTCYLNAGLQMIIQNVDLCKLILKYSHQSLILNRISSIIINYYSDTNNNITPNEIKSIIEHRQNIFCGYQQQDSVEFVIYLLDIIEEEIKKINKDSNELENIFGVNINIKIKCKYTTCLKEHNKQEINKFLMLDMDESCLTLDDLYRKFKLTEQLDNDNLYLCEKCGIKTNALKSNQIISRSNYLLINLKRFKQNGNSVFKQNQLIDVNIKWRHGLILVGAIIHHGSINGGHYVYVGRNNNEWYLFNDSSVSKIDDITLNKYLNHAYLLGYRNMNKLSH